MRFLLDAGVPDLVAQPFRDAGHHVVLHRDLLPEGSPDELVCRTAVLEDAILVAVDRDMRRIARPYGTPGDIASPRTLDLVSLLCAEWQASSRITQAMTFIENEWRFRESKRARRLWIDIGLHFLRTHR